MSFFFFLKKVVHVFCGELRGRKGIIPASTRVFVLFLSSQDRAEEDDDDDDGTAMYLWIEGPGIPLLYQ